MPEWSVCQEAGGGGGGGVSVRAYTHACTHAYLSSKQTGPQVMLALVMQTIKRRKQASTTNDSWPHSVSAWPQHSWSVLIMDCLLF